GRLGEVKLEPFEELGPAAPVVVAHLLVEEALVPEYQLRAAALGGEEDCDERLALGRGARPGPGEDELARPHDLFVGAGALMRVAVRAAKTDPEAAADAHIELRHGHRLARGAPPLLQRLLVGPRPPDPFGRRGVLSREREGGLVGEASFFHV